MGTTTVCVFESNIKEILGASRFSLLRVPYRLSRQGLSAKFVPLSAFTPADSRANHGACHDADAYPQGHRVGRCANRYADANSDCYPDRCLLTLHSQLS